MIAAAFTIVLLHAFAVSSPTQGRLEPHQDPPKKESDAQGDSAKPKPQPKPTEGSTEASAKKVDPADQPFVERGLVQWTDGEWVTPEERDKLEAGWIRQDLELVDPKDKAQIDQGLWKCGEQWLPIEEANKYHSELAKWWKLRGKHFDVWTTCDRRIADIAVLQADGTFANCERIFGAKPRGRPVVLVLRSVDQYNSFATGEGTSSPDLRGFSSLHGSFFAEAWLEPIARRESGAGVAYMDASTDEGFRFGCFYIRHAAAQSYAEAIDPSPKTIAKLVSGSERPQEVAAGFWPEKDLPEWYRYGAAAYCERYFKDTENSDPTWPRVWSVKNIVNKGGLDPLQKIFDLELSLEDATASGKLINEAGLLVAFVVDGECAPVQDAHKALAAALEKGEGIAEAGKALQAQILNNEAKLRAFAGI